MSEITRDCMERFQALVDSGCDFEACYWTDVLETLIAAWEREQEVRVALGAYHHALDTRQHGGVAADVLVKRVESIYRCPWEQGSHFYCPSCGEESKLHFVKGNTIVATACEPTIKCTLCGTMWRVTLHEAKEAEHE